VNHVTSGRASDKSDPVASWFGQSVAGTGVRYASSATGGFAVVQALGMHVQLTFVSETGQNLYCANFTSNRVVVDPISSAGTPTINPSKIPTTIPTRKPTNIPSTRPTESNGKAKPSIAPTSITTVKPVIKPSS